MEQEGAAFHFGNKKQKKDGDSKHKHQFQTFFGDSSDFFGARFGNGFGNQQGG